MNICGQDFTLYVDYDRGKFRYLDVVGKVTYMRSRVERDLIRPCRTALRLQDRIAVGLLVPGLRLFRYLGGEHIPPWWPRSKEGGGWCCFKAFVNGYMHADLRQNIIHPSRHDIGCYTDWLYACVRCGLSHSFALEWGHIEGPDRMATYVELHPASEEPRINQNELLEDFVRGWNQYLTQVEAAPAGFLSKFFVRRFDAVFHD